MAIDFHLEDGVALITINRPDRLNAMDAEHYKGLSDAWARVRDDEAVRVAIVTGAGERSFTTGADIKSFVAAPPGIEEMWLTQKDQLLNRGLEVWKPVIAAVNGYCLGGGMTLLLATDIRLAAPHATFSLAEVKRGVIAGNGGTQRVLSQLPYAIGMEMVLTGDAMDAETAARWAFVNRVVPAERLMDEAMAVARKIAANAPARGAGRQGAGDPRPRHAALDGLAVRAGGESTTAVHRRCCEGPKAFAEKRPAAFQGR